jgi:serine protease AprX
MKARTRLTLIFNLSMAFIFLFTMVVPGGQGQIVSAYIVQGLETDQVVAVVEMLGGTVTARLDIINGVGATLSPVQVADLLANETITAVTLNESVLVADNDKKGKDDDKSDDDDGEAKKNKEKKSKDKNMVPETNYPEVVGADVAWENGVTGEGVTVAIVDTGIDDYNGLKKDIHGKKDRIIGWVDFVKEKAKPTDQNGHGTHIAGIIANSEKGADGEWNGIAPGVNLVGVRVLDKKGAGNYEQVIQGIQWVVDHKDEYNIRVMNLSLVSPVHSPYWADPLNQAVTNAWANGIVVVVAGGNGGPDALSIGVPGNKRLYNRLCI